MGAEPADSHGHGQWTHDHVYLGHGAARGERATRLVVLLTAGFMVVEVVAGLAFGSMALLADGIHMATHVGALGLSAAAYWLARRHVKNPRFSFGSGKFGDLAAFSSAILLGVFGLGVGIEATLRLYAPVPIAYTEALVIAGLGLLVNIASAVILHEPHHHAHPHRDHSLRAAYLHVLADALTSVLAITALAAGLVFGAAWLDPLVGMIGALLILRWSVQLLADAGLVLLDAEDDPTLSADIRQVLETEMGARVADLHLWRLGPGHQGLIVSLISPTIRSAEEIKATLRHRYPGLSHVTVEVAVCADCASG